MSNIFGNPSAEEKEAVKFVKTKYADPQDLIELLQSANRNKSGMKLYRLLKRVREEIPIIAGFYFYSYVPHFNDGDPCEHIGFCEDAVIKNVGEDGEPLELYDDREGETCEIKDYMRLAYEKDTWDDYVSEDVRDNFYGVLTKKYVRDEEGEYIKKTVTAKTPLNLTDKQLKLLNKVIGEVDAYVSNEDSSLVTELYGNVEGILFVDGSVETEEHYP